VLRPENGATLSGVELLDAKTSDYLKVTKVEFYLTGGSQHDTLIATADLALYGWFSHWNTATVANGTYTLQSVAYDAAGRSSRSKGIVVTIKN
jgi:hypothetical protein